MSRPSVSPRTLRSHRATRLPQALAALGGLAFLPAVGLAHFIAKPIDTTRNFAMTATHVGDFGADANLALTWGFNWPTDGLIVEDSGFDWDTLTVRGIAWHQNAPPLPPHGEPPNTVNFPFDFFVDGSVEDAGIPLFAFAVKAAAPQGAVIGHNQHQDIFVANLSFTVEWDEDLLSYNFALSGRHTEDGESWQCLETTMMSSPGCDQRDYASVTAIVEYTVGRLDLNASVIGVQRHEVLQALVRMGPPGGGGPILMSLPPSSMLPAADGLMIEASDLPIPPYVAQMMAAGQTSLEIATQSCPNGALGGQLRPANFEQHCPTDLNGDGVVDLTDLTMLLSAFGVDDGGDVDGDGDTDISDLALLLGTFGSNC